MVRAQRRRVWWVVWLSLVVGAAASCTCGDEPSGEARADRGLTSLSPQEMDQKLREDMAALRRYDAGLQQVLDYAHANKALFRKDRDGDLTPEERHEIKQIWLTVLDYLRAVDATKQYWSHFQHFNPVTDHTAHARSYMVSYVSWLIQYWHGLRFLDLTVPNKVMETFLDEGSAEHSIPTRAFAALKYNVIHVKAVSQLLGGQKYFGALEKTLREFYEKDQEVGYAFDLADRYHRDAKQQLKERAAIQFSYNAYDIARDATFSAWFPVQRDVAEWMGDTKVRRLHRHLITHDQIDQMRTRLQPGDILVARHNWYLSNVGLPGFWPHAELYLGTPDELAAWADDPEIQRWVAAQPHGAATLSDHLQKAHPDAWSTWATDAADGHPRRVIEAISEGVSLRSLEEGAGADYVAVIRPRHPKLAVAQAIDKALSLHGRPYDFNFDFLTDESIVCTELVYKSWQPADGKDGPQIELVKVVGRQTLPANDLIRQFDQRYDDPQRPFDFVYFLDGRERAKGAVSTDLDALRASWKRPKWDVLQK
jgi:hypothetical protein